MYRDDRDALLARLDAVTRENEQLRARNAELERPAPPPDTDFDTDSFLADFEEPAPHQTLRGHASAWGTAPRATAPAALSRPEPREVATLIAAIGFAALVTVGCILLLIF